MKWPSINDIHEENETTYLIETVEDGWCWSWPGWRWVADRVNGCFENKRTASSCRNKYDLLMKNKKAKGAP